MRLARAFESVLDLCYPGICARCDRPADRSRLCPACTAELIALESASACARCAMPLARDGDPCPYCTGSGVHPFDRIVRLGVFDGPLKDLIHRMKYHGDWSLAEALADRLWAQDRVRALLSESDALLAVPLHPLRQIARGYNQAQVIAARLARRGRIRVITPAVRLRNTDTQTQLSSQAGRLDNLKDAFGLVRPRAVTGRRIVLVDDVMTSGATLRSLARALRRAKPASISAIVLAVADPKGRGFEAI
jgi:ComF family protein